MTEVQLKRPLLKLQKRKPVEKGSEPLIVSHGQRRAIVKPVDRKTRFMCIVMGKKRGPTKIHKSLESARKEAGRIVAQTGERHCFVVHIVESAKVDWTGTKRAPKAKAHGAAAHA